MAKYLDEYKEPRVVGEFVRRVAALAQGCGRKVRLMEVCGTHTMAAKRMGFSSMVPEGLELISGPGCPVCVSPDSYLQKAVAYARRKDVTVSTFGDMVRVPVGGTSLQREGSRYGNVVIVYSPADSLEIAAQNPGKRVVFLGIGFETTAPAIAATVMMARERKIKNFFVLGGNKLMPPVLRKLAREGPGVHGLICPGHVSTIIGSLPYEFLAREYLVPCVVAGFEPVDILQAVAMLLKQIASGEAKVEVQYLRAVKEEGNRKALEIMHRVFEPCDSEWRGLGEIKGSGLRLKKEFSKFDASEQVPVEHQVSAEDTGCICGEILCGKKKPTDCALFGNRCKPDSPIGPCMVSSEGTCAAYYRYGDFER